MNNNQSPPNEISHKELSTLLNKAKKEISSINTSKSFETEEDQELNGLILHWTETSQKILLMLNKTQQLKSKNPKSLMALGAMGAHINMALQALKATESDQ